MSDSGRVESAHRVLSEGVAALRAAADGDDERIAALVVCEALTRQAEQLSIELVAGLVGDGVFADRGCSRPAGAVADLRNGSTHNNYPADNPTPPTRGASSRDEIEPRTRCLG